MRLSDVAVVGAGAMGHGLAIQCVRHGLDVTLIDHRQVNLDVALERIGDTVEARIDDWPADADGRLTTTLDLQAGVGSADVVLETITEDLSAKRDLFSHLAEHAPPDAVLASNTSSIPVGDIAEAVPDDAGRVAGCHWWYPPYLLRPVEVVRADATDDATIDRLASFVEAVDRDPILVERDVPGFVWNRVQFAVVRECLHVVEEGVASVEDVNRAIRDGYATRTAAVGPFETMDIAGLDLFSAIAGDLFPELADDDRPGSPLTDAVEDGRTGIDAGAGFFEYDDGPEAVTRRRDERVAAIRRALDELDD